MPSAGPAARAGARSAPARPGSPTAGASPASGRPPSRSTRTTSTTCSTQPGAPATSPAAAPTTSTAWTRSGLFGTLPGEQGEVNLRHGLGGRGTPPPAGKSRRPSGGSPATPATPTTQRGERRRLGRRRRPGGGGYDPAQAVAVVPPYELRRGAGTGGGGMGGGFFAAGPGYSPAERGALWGKDAKTAGLDYLVTNFMRSDTPTGVGTAAWSAPQQYWDGLVNAIRQGIIVVSDPQGWAMLESKNPMYTPSNIGGAALTGASGASATGAGRGVDRGRHRQRQRRGRGRPGGVLGLPAGHDPPGRQPDRDGGGAGRLDQGVPGGRADRHLQRPAHDGPPEDGGGPDRDVPGRPHVRARSSSPSTRRCRRSPTNSPRRASWAPTRGSRPWPPRRRSSASGWPSSSSASPRRGSRGSTTAPPTFAARQHQDQTAMNLMQLQSTMRGPRNWDAYQTTFN